MRLAISLIALVLGSTAAARADDGKLEQARDEIRGSGEGDSGDDDSSFADAVSDLFCALFDGDDDSGDSSTAAATVASAPEFGYARYPYERSRGPYLIALDTQLAFDDTAAPASDVATVSLPLHARRWAAQLGLEAGHLDGVTRTGFSARLLTPSEVELDARSALLAEPLPMSDATDHAAIGDAHVGYRIVSTGALMLRLGAGLRYWADTELGGLGADLLLGLDWFPVRPLVVSGQISGGSLGEAVVTDARLQLGVALARVELFAAFEWLQIGDADLSAPLLGARLWL